MKTSGSESFELDIQSIKAIARNILIFFAPVILVFLEQIQNGTFDYKIIGALAVGIIIDGFRRYITDYK